MMVTWVSWSDPQCMLAQIKVYAKGILEKVRSRTCPSLCVGSPGAPMKSMLLLADQLASSGPWCVGRTLGSNMLCHALKSPPTRQLGGGAKRSEERRVGKERICGW